jgi:nitrite reductase/ring-hydroxylating ferredoxin subunit
LGFIALVIFFLMAITSHDFWLHTLHPRIWKTLHMLVYVAYSLIIAHVLLGVLQFETSPILVTLLGLGLGFIIILHLISSQFEKQPDNKMNTRALDEFVMVCDIAEIKEKRAKVVVLADERVAIFKYDNKVSAISNVCKHQNGPLGEGRIIDGCITCPWHGYQYLPHNGSSPPPFKEKVATYVVKVIEGKVWVNPAPNPDGTAIEPALILPQP